MNAATSESKQPRALALFTDREDQRELIDKYLGALRSGEAHQRAGVLSFYGVGGVGKTTLREKAVADFREALRRDLYEIRPYAIAEVDLDSDSVQPDSPTPIILGRVRTALAKADVPTPLFDLLYLIWWAGENPGQAISLKKHVGDGLIGGLLDVAKLAGGVAGFFGVPLPSSDFAEGIHKLFPRVGEWFEQSNVRRRFDGSPFVWSQRERVERMATLLALDLLDAIRSKPQLSICLVIDGFERVQSRESRPDAQWALATMIAEVLRCTDTIPPPDGKPVRGRVGFIVFGRERLRWADLYARERVRTDWKAQIDDHAELLGLSAADARAFLVGQAARWERQQGRAIVADLIERHVGDILRAAAEERPDQPPSYLPYYLDLAVLLIRDNSEGFLPAMLGETPGELERRFLRSLAPQHLRALQALALALEFDRPVFEYLIASGPGGFITGYAGADFAWLVGDHWSFVNPILDRPGFHGFHRHMQSSLVASLRPVDEALRAGEVVHSLLDRLANKMRFERPAEFGLEQQAALGDAIDLLREHEASGLLDGETAIQWSLKLEAPFDSVQAMSLRRPFLEWTLELVSRVRGSDHPDTLKMRNNISLFIGQAGEAAAARDLFLALLPDQQRVLGADHPDTLRTRNNIAAGTGEAGEPLAARDLFLALLPDQQRVLGADHPDTLVTRSNIAGFTGQAGEPLAARDLFLALLPDQQRVLGADYPDTLRTRNNIAAWTGEAGEPFAARDLFLDLLPDLQRVLGAEHPDTLSMRNNIAAVTGWAGEPAAARDLFLALLPDQQRVLGADHPDTLRTRANIALFTGQAGEPAAARDLFLALLPDLQRVLGAEHPDTLTTRNHIALFTGQAGEPAAARDLFLALLPDLQRVLGAEHPHTLATRNNIAAWTGEAGEPLAARDLFLDLLPDQQRVLGAVHPDTLATRSNIAAFTGQAGEPLAARDLFLALLPDLQRVLGAEHPHTLATRSNIATFTGQAGEPLAARDLFLALLPDQQRVLGAEHPHTLATRSNIATFTGQAGEPLAARDLFLALLPDQQRVLGADHPDTRATQKVIDTLGGQIALKTRPSSIVAAVRDSATLTRNSPCPCGSGKRYKQCHGAIT